MKKVRMSPLSAAAAIGEMSWLPEVVGVSPPMRLRNENTRLSIMLGLGVVSLMLGRAAGQDVGHPHQDRQSLRQQLLVDDVLKPPVGEDCRQGEES